MMHVKDSNNKYIGGIALIVHEGRMTFDRRKRSTTLNEVSQSEVVTLRVFRDKSRVKGILFI